MDHTNPPPAKKQKLDTKEEEDDDIVDLSHLASSNNSKSKKKSKVTNSVKLSQLGVITDDCDVPMNILAMKYDIIDVQLNDKKDH